MAAGPDPFPRSARWTDRALRVRPPAVNEGRPPAVERKERGPGRGVRLA